MNRLPLLTRLALGFGLLFMVAGAGVIAVTVTLASRSIEASNSASAPAVDDLKAAINRALAGQSPAPTTGVSTPGEPSLAAKQDAARAEEEARRQLIDANRAYSAATGADAQRRLMLWSGLAAAVLLPGAAMLGWAFARRSLGPLRDVTASVRRVSGSSLSERVGIDGPRDEITELATSFDAMLERLEHAFDAQRRFAADASHELRTPLAVARTAVDVALAKPDPHHAQWRTMATDVRSAVIRAEEVIDGLLTLTRAEHLDHRRETVDLATLVEDALEVRRQELVALDVVPSLQPATVVGDPALLERLVANLIDNAVRHNRPGGSVLVATGVVDGSARVRVENTGPELTQEQVDSLTAPFHRVNGRARTADRGLGLGLTIVVAVAGAHGGRLSLAPRHEGGLVATVDLPVSH